MTTPSIRRRLPITPAEIDAAMAAARAERSRVATALARAAGGALRRLLRAAVAPRAPVPPSVGAGAGRRRG